MIQRIVDIFLTGFSFGGAYFIIQFLLPENYNHLSADPSDNILMILLIIVIWYISFNWMGMYLSYRQKSFSDFFFTILRACSMAGILLVFVLYLLQIKGADRLLIVLFLFLNIIVLTLFKLIVFKIMGRIRNKGFAVRNILIVGSKARAREFIEVVENNKASGYRILGCFDIDSSLLGQSVSEDCKVIGLVRDLEAFMRKNTVDELIFAMPLKMIEKGETYIVLAENMGINIRILPNWEIHYLMYQPKIAAIHFDNFLGIHNMILQSTPENWGALLIKSGFDYLCAGTLSVLLLPVFVLTGVLIKIFSRGPVFYKQERLGLNGRRFMVYKFRTMVKNADDILKNLKDLNEADGPTFKIKNDPRIIPYIGTFLRKTSLDELPQLFNVLKGEMSIVGPRPPIPSEVDQYSVWHRRRLSMKPGMTCLWQIEPMRNDLSFGQWMNLDLLYIDTWSLFNDFKIIILTIKVVLNASGR